MGFRHLVNPNRGRPSSTRKSSQWSEYREKFPSVPSQRFPAGESRSPKGKEIRLQDRRSETTLRSGKISLKNECAHRRAANCPIRTALPLPDWWNEVRLSRRSAAALKRPPPPA